MKKIRVIALALTLIMTLAPFAVFADGEQTKYPMDPTHLTFASQEDCDAIVTRVNQAEITVENGELKAVTKDLAENPDPYVKLSLENLETSIQAEDYPFCVLVYKCPMTNDWKENVVSSIYFCTDGADPDEDRCYSVYVSVGDRYAYAIFNTALLPTWTGTVTSLRLDFFYSHYLKDGVVTALPEGETMYIRDVMFFSDGAEAKREAGNYVYALNKAESPAPTSDMDPTHIVFETQDDFDAIVYRDDGKDPGKRTVISYEDQAVKYTVDLGGTTADPYAYCSFGKLSETIVGEDYPYCAIVYKMPTTNSAATSTLDIYFNTKGSFPVDNSQMLSVSTKTSDGYQYAVFNPGKLDDWNGVVTSLRFDYLNNIMQDGDVFYVHDIIFAADQQSARTAASDIATMLNVPDEAILSFNVGDYGEKPDDQTVLKGELPVRPDDPTSDTMVFDGWYTSKTYNTAFDFTKPLTKEKTIVYAKWVAGMKVTFSCPQNAENVPAVQLVKKNGRAVEPDEPTLEGMDFAGWYTDEALTSAYNFNSLVKADLTLYAKFETAAPRYTVTVDGGTPSAVSAKAGDEVTVTATVAEGTEFRAWTVVSGAIEYAGSLDETPLTFTMPAEDVSLKAEFNYSVVVELPDNIEFPGYENSFFFADGEEASVTAPAAQGYRFVRWDVVSGDIELEDATSSTAKFTMIAGSVVISAVYEEFDGIPGDVNADGKLNSRDVVAVMKAAIPGATVSPEIAARADVNNDGKINSRDVIAVMKLALEGV